jgi:hypothetical protein
MSETAKRASGEWNYIAVILAALVGFALGGPITGKVASRNATLIAADFWGGWLVLGFCVFVLIRTLVARLRHERSKTWIAYAAFALLSPLWIRWLVEFVLIRVAA